MSEQLNGVTHYTLVNELQNFYDPCTNDPCAVLMAMAEWIELNPDVEPNSIHVTIGFDGQQPWVEGTVDHTRRDG